MNQSYQSASPFYDEMLLGNGQYCSHYRDYRLWLKQADQHTVARKQDEAELLFHRVGITFNVYGQDGGAGDGSILTACRALSQPANGAPG